MLPQTMAWVKSFRPLLVQDSCGNGVPKGYGRASEVVLLKVNLQSQGCSPGKLSKERHRHSPKRETQMANTPMRRK